MKARMSEVPAEMGPAMKFIAERGRNAPLRASDAMGVSGRRATER